MIPSGFEPETHSLEGCCSIQLSYGTINHLYNDGAKVTLFCDIHKFFLLFLFKMYFRMPVVGQNGASSVLERIVMTSSGPPTSFTLEPSISPPAVGGT